tara:strand:+ start:643 stop:747 length:105 start_codon:yes stop_codon:yes gene_type:complete
MVRFLTLNLKILDSILAEDAVKAESSDYKNKNKF